MSREYYQPRADQEGWSASQGSGSEKVGQGLPERRVLSREESITLLREQLERQAQHAAAQVRARVMEEQPQGILPTIATTARHAAFVGVELLKNVGKFGLIIAEHANFFWGYGVGDITALVYSLLGASPLNGKLSNKDIRREMYGIAMPLASGSDAVWLGRRRDEASGKLQTPNYGYSDRIGRTPVLGQLQRVMLWMHGGQDTRAQLPQLPSAPQRPR